MSADESRWLGDLAERRDKLREALEKIIDEGDFEIASAALEADNNSTR